MAAQRRENAMKDEVRICEEGLEECPKSWAVLGNFMMLLWIALGTVGCWFFHPVAAWVYLGVAVVTVFFVLRRLVCVNCYYYGKWCPTGWGKLTALFFRQGSVEKFSTSAGVKLAPIAYGLLSAVPIGLIIYALVKDVTAPKVAVLVLLLLVSFYSGTMSRRTSCSVCKMRLICPGSAVKSGTAEK
jgi:membrane protein YdbS with pleckstrin-like domain